MGTDARGTDAVGAHTMRTDPGDTALRWTSLAEDPAAADVLSDIERDAPPFLAELTRRHRDRLTASAPATSWVVAEGDLPVAGVRAVALAWDGTSAGAPAAGAGEALDRAGEPDADTLVVLDVTVAYGARGRGLGPRILADLDRRRTQRGLARVLVLLRPHTKATYPLVPFARYVSFTRADGQPFDPWFRAAWRAGLVPVMGVDRSLNARADLASWARWLDVEVPGSGPYLVDGAIKPAIVEVELDEGRYREPHLWVGSGGDGSSDGGWITALARAGVVAGDRAHREPKRRG
jgi:GNAT superfamily N-acetyltransferase